MIEVARIVAGIALVPLILAMAAGLSPLGRRQLRRLNGISAVDDRYLKAAAYLLMTAVGLSCVAAFLAISIFFTV
jgi:hypothetical protein